MQITAKWSRTANDIRWVSVPKKDNHQTIRLICSFHTKAAFQAEPVRPDSDRLSDYYNIEVNLIHNQTTDSSDIF